MHIIQRHLLECINSINTFSKTRKNVYITYSERKLHNDRRLQLEQTEIQMVDDYKFFGIILDIRISFIPHFKYLKRKCTEALQL